MEKQLPQLQLCEQSKGQVLTFTPKSKEKKNNQANKSHQCPETWSKYASENAHKDKTVREVLKDRVT